MTSDRFRASRWACLKPLVWFTLCTVVVAGMLVPAACAL